MTSSTAISRGAESRARLVSHDEIRYQTFSSVAIPPAVVRAAGLRKRTRRPDHRRHPDFCRVRQRRCLVPSRAFPARRSTSTPTVVAGVPPDYFSRDGQRWGNPLYDWAAMAALRTTAGGSTVFARLLALVDVVRIDHFRGFAANWSVPFDAETAAEGWWDRGPGDELFRRS